MPKTGGYYAAKKTSTTPWLWILAAIGALAAVGVAGYQFGRADTESTPAVDATSVARVAEVERRAKFDEPFGLRKGTPRSEFSELSPYGETGVFATEKVPRPDDRFLAYLLEFDGDDLLCRVRGVQLPGDVVESEKAQNSFWELYRETAVVFGEGKVGDLIDEPHEDFDFRLLSVWPNDEDLGAFPSSEVSGIALLLKENESSEAYVEVQYELGDC